jgi:hypothetical protein
LGEREGSVYTIPIHYLTRHGIIAGSTGTGKSRAMQVLAEQLSDSGISVFVSDVKGDASGFCIPCAETEVPDEHPAWPAELAERNRLAPFQPRGLKADYWSVGARFASLRFSLSEAGSVLLSRLLFLNPTQESILAIAFSYARKNGRPMDGIGELQDILDEMVQSGQRGISPSSVSVIQRKLMALEDSGLARLFSRPSLQISDLKGLNVLNLSDARRDMSAPIAPAFLLNKLFNELPEVGDAGKPSFVIFFDEAHYLFRDSNKSLRDLMVTILKQIRSKGVAVFFVTQDASDLPEEILAQLSTKIIFSQKTLTEKGNSRLRALAKSFPGSDEGLAETLKSLPPGTAIVSTLDGSGNQTSPAQVKVFAPGTTMAIVPDDVLRKATDPRLIAKYAEQKAVSKKAQTLLPISKPSQAVHQPVSRPAQPPPAQKAVSEKKAVEKAKKRGPSIWDGIFGFLLKLVDFTLKALGKVAHALIIRPMQGFVRWLFKKPIRLIYLLLALLLFYVVFVNWPIISAFLAALKIK